MIKVYTVMACSSCKKAKEWLANHGLEFEEINLITDKIDPEDFLKIFS
ncbi:MAG: glutaredoxin domain-containing protein, partial [Lactococcus sp.]